MSFQHSKSNNRILPMLLMIIAISFVIASFLFFLFSNHGVFLYVQYFWRSQASYFFWLWTILRKITCAAGSSWVGALKTDQHWLAVHISQLRPGTFYRHDLAQTHPQWDQRWLFHSARLFLKATKNTFTCDPAVSCLSRLRRTIGCSWFAGSSINVDWWFAFW